jgi:hypothetical protein
MIFDHQRDFHVSGEANQRGKQQTNNNKAHIHHEGFSVVAIFTIVNNSHLDCQLIFLAGSS